MRAIALTTNQYSKKKTAGNASSPRHHAAANANAAKAAPMRIPAQPSASAHPASARSHQRNQLEVPSADFSDGRGRPGSQHGSLNKRDTTSPSAAVLSEEFSTPPA